jgi:hypothetical protein
LSNSWRPARRRQGCCKQGNSKVRPHGR